MGLEALKLMYNRQGPGQRAGTIWGGLGLTDGDKHSLDSAGGELRAETSDLKELQEKQENPELQLEKAPPPSRLGSFWLRILAGAVILFLLSRFGY